MFFTLFFTLPVKRENPGALRAAGAGAFLCGAEPAGARRLMERFLYLGLDLFSLAFPCCAVSGRASPSGGSGRGCSPASRSWRRCSSLGRLVHGRRVWGFNERYLVGIRLFGLPWRNGSSSC